MVDRKKEYYVACYPCGVVVEGLSNEDASRAMDEHLEANPSHFNRVKNPEGQNYSRFKRVSLNEFIKPK